MFDYRNNLKRILQNTSSDDKSLKNSLAAIKAVLAMEEESPVSSKSQNTSIDATLINNFLKYLTLLISEPGNKEAKTGAINSLHKLTFEPGVGKKYGKQLGKLDQAILSSKETQTVKESKLFKKAINEPAPKKPRDYRKGKRYTVIRLVSGADLIDDNGNIVYSIKESQIHSLGLKSGDIVEAVESQNPNYEADILRTVGYQKLRKRDYDQMEEFKYAVVQKKSGSFSISRNIRGEKLKVRGKAVTIFVDSSYYQGENINLVDGSIVDLAWYTGDVRLKKNPSEAIKIRWIYQTEQSNQTSSQKSKKKKLVTEKELSQLDMDLHYQRVGIAIGDNQNEGILESIVTKYNGIPVAIDAFEGKKKVIENQIKDLDIVILVTAYAAHDSTWNIREFASKYGSKFAVSSSKGYQSFERALYRADKGLPAYEGNQTIDYKIKS